MARACADGRRERERGRETLCGRRLGCCASLRTYRASTPCAICRPLAIQDYQGTGIRHHRLILTSYGRVRAPRSADHTWGAVWQYFEKQTRDKEAGELALPIALNHRSEVRVNRRTKLTPSMTLRQ